jgi:hypothetical protein
LVAEDAVKVGRMLSRSSRVSLTSKTMVGCMPDQ